jgi:ribosome-binding factor A
MPPRHVQRLASRIKFLVGHIVQQELNDPRLGFVTVLEVELTDDLREATVHVSVLGSRGERSKSLHALQDARGYVQRRVGKNLEIRRTPTIRFVLEEPQDDRVARIEAILAGRSAVDADSTGSTPDGGPRATSPGDDSPEEEDPSAR